MPQKVEVLLPISGRRSIRTAVFKKFSGPTNSYNQSAYDTEKKARGCKKKVSDLCTVQLTTTIPFPKIRTTSVDLMHFLQGKLRKF